MSIETTISKLLHPHDPVSKVKAVFEGIADRDAAKAVQYISPDKFVNHNVRAPEGVAGFELFISHLPPGRSPIHVLRILQDGDYVVTHATGNVMGDKVLFDIFRFEDGLIVEHWDNLTEATPPNESGHTATDGPTEIEDRDKTESNKALVRSFYEAIFLQAKFEQMPQFFDGDKYIRHDARGGDGLSSLNKLMQEQAQQGTTMSVSKIHLVLGEGNFVLVVAEGAISDKPVAYYDLFRIENGKIAEHWDVIENIPPRAEWRNQNGKF